MQLFMEDVLRELNQALEWMNRLVVFLFGVSQFWANVIVIVFVVEILIFFLFIPLHRHLLTKLERVKQELVKQIDEIIYLLAKVQYDAHISRKEFGGDPHMAMMKEMFKSGHFEYLDNIPLIRENVEKVELLLKKQVVTAEQWDTVNGFQKKMKRLMFWKKSIGILCSICTLGIYKLFR
jgi:hypothetical protein